MATVVCVNIFCNTQSTSQQVPYFLNHNDSVKYVGMQTCRSCHEDIYQTYIRTGMGQSFGAATPQKSSADFGKKHVVYDSLLDLHYHPFWKNDSLYISEFRLSGKDTIHQRSERVDYIIGSGQHTNSHLMNVNGYIYQLPLTWYAQEKKWDLPPGFEKGRNTRFSRIINIECMSCHNAMPQVHAQTENKFINIPLGIDCERCHGPGEVHVQQKITGNRVDTSMQPDYSIVNPRRLVWERQIDLCQRCHLQGNAILKPGKQFTDFRPGMILSDFWDVFMPQYHGADDEFIMASHAERLQMSKCFTSSTKEMATAKLTCITCHNPHVSVKETGTQVFNVACGNCHNMQNDCKQIPQLRLEQNNNCVGCHMPNSATIDIPHVTVHDHKIKVPASNVAIEQVKQFAGIYSINNSAPTPLSKAKAYISYVESFEGEIESLDSADIILRSLPKELALPSIVHSYYVRNKFHAIVALSLNLNANDCDDAYMAYRIGTALQEMNKPREALSWLQKSITLSPEQFEFINKLAINHYMLGQTGKAIELLELSLQKNRNQPDAWNNAGFMHMQKRNFMQAENYFKTALTLDPDLYNALANYATYLKSTGQNKELIHVEKRLQNIQSKSIILQTN
jgi:hypothetical protein